MIVDGDADVARFFCNAHKGARPRRRGVLNEAGREVGVQDGVYLFGEDRIKPVGARLNRLGPRGYLDFKRTEGAFTIVQFRKRENVRVGGKCVGESVDGRGISTGGVQSEVYSTNMGRHSVPSSRFRSSGGGSSGKSDAVVREGDAGVVGDSARAETSVGTSWRVSASKGTRRRGDEAVSRMSPGSKSWYPVKGNNCRPEETNRSEGSKLPGAGGKSTV